MQTAPIRFEWLGHILATPDNFQLHGKVMVWSAGPDGKIDPTATPSGLGSANYGANKDNVLSWQ